MKIVAGSCLSVLPSSSLLRETQKPFDDACAWEHKHHRSAGSPRVTRALSPSLWAPGHRLESAVDMPDAIVNSQELLNKNSLER